MGTLLGDSKASLYDWEMGGLGVARRAENPSR
jgi:hypothetical protein